MHDTVVACDEAVLDVTRALACRCVVIFQREGLARRHLEEVNVLFHDVAEPCGDTCPRRLFDGVIGKGGVLVERQDRIAVGNVRAEVECDLAEVFKGPRLCALALDVEDVVRGGLVAADEFARDGDGCIVCAVADGDGVARGPAIAAREAAVDIACNTAAVEAHGVVRGRAAG